MMALTMTDDRSAQETAFYGASEWRRGASTLRERLTEREIGANNPPVRNIAAYHASAWEPLIN